MARTMYRDQRGLKKAFCCGLLVGCAIIAEWWVCFVVPALIWYLYAPMKINNLKVFYSTILGVLTPLWVMLPYWIFV